MLIVAPWLPWPVDFGGAARVYHLARGLAEQHEVMLLAPAGPNERRRHTRTRGVVRRDSRAGALDRAATGRPREAPAAACVRWPDGARFWRR